MSFLGIILLGVALLVLYYSLRHYSLNDIMLAFYSIPSQAVLAAIVMALFGYLMLSLYDWLALSYAGEKLPYPKVLLTSFLGYAFSNNIGYPLISGAAIRYRFYSRWGIPLGSIARIVLFCTSSYVVGAITLLVLIYLFAYSSLPYNEALSPKTLTLIMQAATAIFILWWGLIIFYHKPLRIKKFELSLPPIKLAIGQTFVAILDVFIASLVLYLPFSANLPIDLSHFVMLFIMAQLLALASQVPGGLGVFEGSFIFLTQGMYPPSDVLAALMICRVSYYFIPLALAGIIFIFYEIRRGIGNA